MSVISYSTLSYYRLLYLSKHGKIPFRIFPRTNARVSLWPWLPHIPGIVPTHIHMVTDMVPHSNGQTFTSSTNGNICFIYTFTLQVYNVETQTNTTTNIFETSKWLSSYIGRVKLTLFAWTTTNNLFNCLINWLDIVKQAKVRTSSQTSSHNRGIIKIINIVCTASTDYLTKF